MKKPVTVAGIKKEDMKPQKEFKLVKKNMKSKKSSNRSFGILLFSIVFLNQLHLWPVANLQMQPKIIGR